jgi:2-C-methyl-D-erythritol 4-phosphate cytidylyltransferase/2-C-methyl-D-erythritol 2,4-cyclodiphosphate synthase
MVGVVIPAAGQGSRFGSAVNKIFAPLAGRTALEHTLSAFESHEDIQWIVVAASRRDMERIKEITLSYSKVLQVVEGGESRQESVFSGLQALPNNCEIVLVHDAARPLISRQLISAIIDTIRVKGSAVPGIPIRDTVKRAHNGVVTETVPRDNLWAVQTPQGARRETLLHAFHTLGARIRDLTDEASVLEAIGFPVHIVDGEVSNLKLTVPEDIPLMEFYLMTTPQSPATYRTGMGYDVHQFVKSRELWLGGVHIPHTLGLKGHSDADAALHALCDALLGGAGLGDIGVLFPDTDPAHENRASMEFVEETADLLKRNGWKIENVDLTILAETPKIGPWRNLMIDRIASGLQVERDRVNIKATTSEKMGFVGRSEGIACWAIATLSR